MRTKSALFSAAASMLLAGSAWSQANHLILSEMLMNSPNTETSQESAEFLEIFNPTASSIDLSNYYVTDNNLYYTLPATPAGLNCGTSDYLLRFPAGTILPSGGVAVVTCHANRLAAEYFSGDIANFGASANRLLFEVANSNAGVPNIINLNTNVTADGQSNLSFTNGGEFVVLFHWDGATDLVQDVDIAGYGAPTGGNAYAPKGGQLVDGPDGDSTTTAYAAEAGTITNLSVNATAPAGMNRTTINEPSEATSAGNGITGHDETTEVVATSWAGNADSAATPGVTSLIAAGANNPPSISAVGRDIVFPGSSSTIVITATLTDSDGTIASAAVQVNSGSGFAPVAMTQVGVTDQWTANIGPFADNTYVKYYITATDDDTDTALSPVNAPTGFNVFYVDNTPVTDDTAIRFNEVLYDNPGSDIYEFVEIANLRNEPVDLGYFVFFDVIDTANRFVIPEGTIIPANGYLVLAQDAVAMQALYPGLTNIVDWGTWSLNNSQPADAPAIVHVNTYVAAGPNTAIDTLPYDVVAPWPTEAAGGGSTLELIVGAGDNSLSTSWAASPTVFIPAAQPFSSGAGTPGLVNGSTAVTNWEMFQD